MFGQGNHSDYREAITFKKFRFENISGHWHEIAFPVGVYNFLVTVANLHFQLSWYNQTNNIGDDDDMKIDPVLIIPILWISGPWLKKNSANSAIN